MAANAGVFGVGVPVRRAVRGRPVPVNNHFGWNVERFSSSRGDLADCTRDVEVTILWLQLHNLLATDLNCPNCGTACREGHLTASQDVRVFRCPDRQCRCLFSIRKNSFFRPSRLSIPNILKFIYLWSVGVLRYIDLLHDLGEDVMTRVTLVRWCGYMREVCATHIQNRHPIGGVGHIVEIDESLFGRRKNHRGRLVPQQWVLGGTDRHTRECFLIVVPRRDAATLIPIIRAWVLPGTVIMTDEWRAYRPLPLFGYIHRTINHRTHYVNPRNRRVHTQNVESMWNAAKKKFQRMLGTRRPFLQSYLDEFVWRRQYGRTWGQSFHNILTHIAEQYPV